MKAIGTISKNTKLSLNNTKIMKTTTTYFKIKDSNYYIYYKDIKKTKNIDKININSNYLSFNKNIITKNQTIFLENKKEVLKINKSVNLPIEYMDDDYYHVIYLNKLLQIKKDDKINIIENINNQDKESEYISIINYQDINVDKLKNSLQILKENNFYSISVDEYKSWLKNNIRLKENAILLITNKQSDELDNIEKEYNYNIENIENIKDIKFNNSLDKSTKDDKLDSVNNYIVNNTTTIENFKKIISGEKIIIKPVINTNIKTNEQSIPVLNYHFFYDDTTEQCNENICLQTSRFREQLDYLKENNYKTLSIDEFIKWMYGEIELPEKSVLITIDDGAMGTSKINGNKLIPILEEYKMHATLFLITAWWDKSDYSSKYLDVESHGNDIHITGTCGKAKIHCLSKNELISDFKTSIDKLNTNKAFCFPFYAYNNTAIEAVKESGFKVSFIGGNRKAKKSDNKYLIPRYPIHKSTTFEQFKQYIN